MRSILFIFLLSLHFEGFSQRNKNIDLVMSWSSGLAYRYSDIWGYEKDGREYAIIGSNWGTHFIDVTLDWNTPNVIGSFQGGATDVIWRDFKTYSHYAYGVADGSDSNTLQIFDLQYLPDSVVKIYDSQEFSNSCHNIFINKDRLYMASNKRVSGNNFTLEVFSLQDPEKPELIGSFDNSYFGNEGVHDIYVRNDTAYVSSSYAGLFIYDFKDISNPKLISSITSYTNQGYNHSSWLSDDGNTLVFCDEVPSGLKIKLYDVTDKQNMELLDVFQSNEGATPHNAFIKDDKIIIAYYLDGVRIFDFSDKTNVREVAYYDTYLDNEDYISWGPYNGAWGVYPYLPSGNIIASDISYGLFVLKPNWDEMSNQSEIVKEEYQIFPNPALNYVQITYSNIIESITLTNSLGQEIKRIKNTSKNIGIDISELKNGIYFLQIESLGNLYTEKIVIKK